MLVLLPVCWAWHISVQSFSIEYHLYYECQNVCNKNINNFSAFRLELKLDFIYED